MKQEENDILEEVHHWLEEVVIGLQLCPFAKAPYQAKQVRLTICKAREEEAINQALINECQLLDKQTDIETTLIICPYALEDFFEYSQFLVWAEQSLKRHSWRGVYQIASFHPHYCFANTEAESPENLTNRSPYPILHLLREASLEQILARYQEPENITKKNIHTMLTLSEGEKKALFSYLFTN